MKKEIILVLVFLFVIACDKIDHIDNNNRPSTVRSLNLDGANYLAIKNQKIKNINTSDWSNLFKLTKINDELIPEKVGFKDGNDNLIDSVFSLIQIDEICSISNDYLCMKGKFECEIDSLVDKLSYSTILVRISDGAIFNFNGHYPGIDSYYMGRKYLQVDKSGDLYYSYSSDHYSRTVYKLGGINITIPFQETYLSSSQYQSQYFYISPDANCYYYGYPKTKIKLSSGGIISADRFLANFFNSADKVYAAVEADLFHIEIIDDQCVSNQVSSIKTPMLEYLYFYSNDYYYLLGDMMEFIELGIVGFIFNESENKLLNLSIPENMENELYEVVDFADKYLWVSSINSTNKEFYRFDLDKYDIKIPYPDIEPSIEVAILNSYELIEIPDSIEIYNYSILNNGEISFIGYNLSSEIDITGVISLDNEITIIKSSSDYIFQILERIN
jgi:hypothetical protein